MEKMRQEELCQLLGFRPTLDMARRRLGAQSVVHVRWMPLTGLDGLLSAFADWGAGYEERGLLRRTKDAKAQLYCRSGTWGTYRLGLFVSKDRSHLFRRFRAHRATTLPSTASMGCLAGWWRPGWTSSGPACR